MPKLTRQFISGRMTNDEYESGFDTIEYDKNDQVIREVYRQVWFLYDDVIISPDDKKSIVLIARGIMQ